MDDLFRNMYSDSDSFVLGSNAAAIAGGGGMRNRNVSKAANEECWDILHVGGNDGGKPLLTPSDFLVTAEMMNEVDVRMPPAMAMAPRSAATVAFGMDAPLMNPGASVPALPFAQTAATCVQNGYGLEFANGVAASPSSGSIGYDGRGKRNAAMDEASMDKATQQKQRRMIKNRESAARSRERKQALTVELESLVAQLEEDGASLLREHAEKNRQRYKQLREKKVPIVEKPWPSRTSTSNDHATNMGLPSSSVLQRRKSMTWQSSPA